MFLALGFSERERELRESLDAQRSAEASRKLAEEAREAALRGKNALKVSFDFTPQDHESAMLKLTDAAWR
jgi:hypothetical protein